MCSMASTSRAIYDNINMSLRLENIMQKNAIYEIALVSADQMRYADEGLKLLLSFSVQWREMSVLMTHRATNDVE